MAYHFRPKRQKEHRAFYIEDPAAAKQEVQHIMENKDEYDLDHDGVLDERELELAMEKESKSTWVQMNSLFATHPPTFKRILLLEGNRAGNGHGKIQQRQNVRSRLKIRFFRLKIFKFHAKTNISAETIYFKIP